MNTFALEVASVFALVRYQRINKRRCRLFFIYVFLIYLRKTTSPVHVTCVHYHCRLQFREVGVSTVELVLDQNCNASETDFVRLYGVCVFMV